MKNAIQVLTILFSGQFPRRVAGLNKKFWLSVSPVLLTNPYVLLILLITSASMQAQILFEQVPPPQPAPQTIADFDRVEFSSIAFADVDGDGDQDVLITGLNNIGINIAKLYINDGAGSYTLVSGAPFVGVRNSSIAFADVDGDGDQDVLITGEADGGAGVAKLYTNDGLGGFSLVSNTPFEGAEHSSIAFADVDGDGDQDVLITGSMHFGTNGSTQRIAKLYTNNGLGVFTLVSGTPFDGVYFSSVAFADVDGDGDQDVLITGTTGGLTYELIAKLYSNDGTGVFTLVSGTPFEGVSSGSVAFADVDGDGDQDVLITGYTGVNGSNQIICKLYTNDGFGVYTLVSEAPFEGVWKGSIAFVDVDGDNDQDVLITGQEPGQLIAKLYSNDGSGIYTLVNSTPFDGVYYSSVAFADVDGDGDQDVLITGQNSSDRGIARFYTNDGNGNYTFISGTPFDGVEFSSVATADVDGDGNQDVLITGRNEFNQRIAKLYTNDGTGGYTLVSGTPFDGVYSGSIEFADVDGDGDQDVLITGVNNSGELIAKLFTNDGSGNFSLVIDTPFDGVWKSSIAFADVDGDGDQDVLMTGLNSSSERIAKLYHNDGSGNFSLMNDTPFDGVYSSAIEFADVDGDGDQDVMITGSTGWFMGQNIAKLYTNDGTGAYTLASGTPFDGGSSGSIAFADVDGDGDQDVLITGLNSSNKRSANLYTNDGTGGYTLASGPFEKVVDSSIAFADVDEDGDLDVLITGLNNNSKPIAKLYTNDGSGNFSLKSDTSFDKVKDGDIAFTDVDGDGKQDLLITGSDELDRFISKLYRNVSTPCIAVGGTVSSSSPRQNLCIGDGVSNIVQLTVSGNVGQGRFGLVRQSDLQVVATNSTGTFNMENFPAVSYLAGYISVNDLSELEGVSNVNDLSGCYDLSNYLSITTVALNGGAITANNGTTACGNDGNPSNLSFTSTGSAGPNFMWAVLSQNYSTVLESNTTGIFDFDQFGPGIYRVVRIVYSNVNPATIDPPSLPPCVVQSNVITINITSCGFGLHSQPNPTEGESIVSFTAVSDEWYTLEVYDMQGRHIQTLMSQMVQTDQQYRYTFNGSALPNGVYIYRLTTDTEVVIEKFMIAR